MSTKQTTAAAMGLKSRLALCWRILRERQGNLMAHADRELPHIGTDEMGLAMARDLRELVFVFSTQGHSGFSASYATGVLEKLLRYAPITPLTGEPGEWMEVSHGVHQNIRCGHVFKSSDRFDGIPYDLDAVVFREASGACFTGHGSQQPITFPYTPKTTYIDVDADGSPLNGWNREGLCPEWSEAAPVTEGGTQ